jgi:hypothetical protein
VGCLLLHPTLVALLCIVLSVQVEGLGVFVCLWPACLCVCVCVRVCVCATGLISSPPLEFPFSHGLALAESSGLSLSTYVCMCSRVRSFPDEPWIHSLCVIFAQPRPELQKVAPFLYCLVCARSGGCPGLPVPATACVYGCR